MTRGTSYPSALFFGGCTRAEAERRLRRWLAAMAADAHRELESDLLCAPWDTSGEGMDPDSLDAILDSADAAWQQQIEHGVSHWLSVLEREGLIRH